MRIPEIIEQRTVILNAQNCGSYSFSARIKIVTEMHGCHQHLSIGRKNSLFLASARLF